MSKIAITSTIYSDDHNVYDILEKKYTDVFIFDADMYIKYLLSEDDTIKEHINDTLYWNPYYDGHIKDKDIDIESFIVIMNLLKEKVYEKYNELRINRIDMVLFKMSLLFELSFHKDFDKVIFIERNMDNIIKSMQNNGHTYSEAHNIFNNLYDPLVKRNLSFYNIKNNIHQKNLNAQINKLVNYLKREYVHN